MQSKKPIKTEEKGSDLSNFKKTSMVTICELISKTEDAAEKGEQTRREEGKGHKNACNREGGYKAAETEGTDHEEA